MILYGSSLSPFVRKVLAYAGEKGIELDLQGTGFPNHNEEFCAASPFKKMPALADGNFRLADLTAIIHYLEAKFPEPPLIPKHPELLGKAIWYEEFADTILAACGAKMFFHRVVAPRFMGRPGDHDVADAAEREELPPLLDYLERVVPAEDEGFLVGDTITVADLAVASPFANLGHLNVRIEDGRHRRLKNYVHRILSRPSFATWIEREKAFFEQAAA